jgi:hypothetical protein
MQVFSMFDAEKMGRGCKNQALNSGLCAHKAFCLAYH